MVKVIKLPRPDEEPVSVPQPPEPANYMIVWVDINSLRPAPWNPPKRTTRRAVLPIIRRMQEEGFEAFRPILLSKDGFIGDGHRRWTAAKHCGMTRVPVIYVDKGVEELWAGNLGAKSPSAKDWMAVNILGGVKGLPPRVEDGVTNLLAILGEEGVRYLIERGQSPDIWRTVWKIGQHCHKTEQAFLRKATYWLIKHQMIDKVKKAIYAPMGEQIEPRTLIQAITNDYPLRSAWVIEEVAS